MRVWVFAFAVLSCCVALGDVHRLSCGGNLGTATHIGDGVLLTCRHCVDGVDHSQLTIDGHPAEVLRVDDQSDLATLYCAELKDEPGYIPAPDGHEVPVGAEVTAYGYAPDGGEMALFSATNRVLRYMTVSSDIESNATQVECNFTVHSGMSGGALLDSSGYLIGIVNGNAVQNRCCYCTCTTTFWRVVYRVPAYHPWRPVLHIWTSQHCGPCNAFWTDFTTDAAFRAAIEANFRLPRLPSGLVNQDAYNVDRRRVLANSWGIQTVPTFGINPATRIVGYGPADRDPNCPPEARGMDRKGYLLWRLGLIVSQPAVSVPQSPPAQQPQPTPAAVIESTGPCVGCAERFDELGGRLTRMESRLESLSVEVQAVAGRTPPAFDDTELRDKIAALEAELASIELTPGPAGPPGRDGEPRTITVIIQDDEGNRLAAPVAVPPTASTVRIPIERFVRE